MSSINPKKKSKAIWWILLAVVAVIVGVFALRGNKGKDAIEVSVDKSLLRNITETVNGTGKIYPIEEIKISSDVSGTLVEVFVHEGDSVRMGQLLARVNPDALASLVERAEASSNSTKSQTESLRAQLQQAKIQLQNAQLVHTRNQKLLSEGLISVAETDVSANQLANAEANINTIQKNIQAAEFTAAGALATVKEQRVNLGRTSIYAAMSGIITTISRKRGEQVVGTQQMAGTEIMRIANMRAIEARVDVSENDIIKVKRGDSVDIEVDAYIGQKFRGLVTHIANTANGFVSENSMLGNSASDKVTNFTVKVLFVNSVANRVQFLPGMSASAKIETKNLSNSLCVPIQAVTTREDTVGSAMGKIKEAQLKEVVFVVQGDSLVQKNVKTGIQDNAYIQLLEGIGAGVSVVTAPYAKISKDLKTGDKVKVVDKKELYSKMKE